MQSILIETPYASGAKCEIMDAHANRWVVSTTPRLLAIKAGYPPLVVLCRKPGYKDTTARVEEYVNHTYDKRKVTHILEDVVALTRDPYGAFASRYPDHIKIWMEPYHWPSDEFMRQWAYEREVYSNEMQQSAEKREADYLEYKRKSAPAGEDRENPIFLKTGE